MATPSSTHMHDPNCFRPMPAVSNGILQGDMPLHFALPLLTIQIALVLLVTRTVAQLFKPIKQPRVLAEIIGGVLLGPTALGRYKFYMETLFPRQSIPLLETVATMGLMFFIFMVGLELDLSALKKTGKKALAVGTAGIMVPFLICMGLAPLLRKTINPDTKLAPLVVFVGTPLSISAFCVLVRIMGELKLLATDIGKLAVPIAAINDVTVWTLLAVGVAITATNKHSSLTPLWVLLSGATFGVIMLTAVRMFITLIARRATSSRVQSTEIYVCVTLVGVLMAGFFSDAIGIHPLLGPFLFGLVIPKDNTFPQMITEKIEDMVTGLMLPLFFASSGLKTNLGSLHGWISLGFLVVFFATAAVGKIMGTFVMAKLTGLPTSRALILGFLVNTKGLSVLIVLNIGRDLNVLTDETFAILVLTALLTSFVTTPVVSALCKTLSPVGDHYTGCHVENVQASRQQLRVMACGYENVHFVSMMNLLEACRGSKGGHPMKLYTLRLMELTDKPSALHELILSNSTMSTHCSVCTNGRASSTKVGNLDNITMSFHPSSLLSKVIVRPCAAISKLQSIHEDICKLAREKRATLLILPYQKPLEHLNVFNNVNQDFYKVNSKVLDHAPCSVAILVDASSMAGASTPLHPCFFSYKIVVLFLGGPDDREALALGTRMADHPGVALKVVRIITLDKSASLTTLEEEGEEEEGGKAYGEQQCANSKTKCNYSNLDIMNLPTDDRLLDDEAISKVKEKAIESSFAYEEEKTGGRDQSLEDAINLITKTMTDANMFVLGRRSSASPRNNNKKNFDNHHNHHSSPSMDNDSELGIIGDMVLSCAGPNFHACVLVVQQCASTKAIDETSTIVTKQDDRCEP